MTTPGADSTQSRRTADSAEPTTAESEISSVRIAASQTPSRLPETSLPSRSAVPPETLTTTRRGMWRTQWEKFRAGSLLDKIFIIGLLMKVIDGLAELIGGTTLIFVRPWQLVTIAHHVTDPTLHHHPHSWWANYLVHSAQHLNTGMVVFGAAYLLVHGIIKVVLAWAVIRDQLWAYPWMIAALIAFALWQGYEIVRHPGIFLILFTAFDVFLIWLTWLEYRRHRHASHDRKTAAAQS